MDIFILAMLVALGAHLLRSKYQRERIALLGSHLGSYQIEKQMESLTQGYLRALGEADLPRRQQIFELLTGTEAALCDQLNRFSAEFSKVDEARTRVSRLPVAVPYVDKLLPALTFDMRKAVAIHAQGVNRAVENSAGRSARDRAFTVSAELFLLQHTCHWFCKSKTIASARMLMQQKTAYEQLIASVSPETRRAYQALIGE
ncbi:MAG: hypothetical protein JWR60_3755 [Polaromonas sp.]|nr:hypothetical protein [Polaromonas sp.]